MCIIISSSMHRRAFAGSRAKTLIVKTEKLTKKSVKGCLKGSKISMPGVMSSKTAPAGTKLYQM